MNRFGPLDALPGVFRLDAAVSYSPVGGYGVVFLWGTARIKHHMKLKDTDRAVSSANSPCYAGSPCGSLGSSATRSDKTAAVADTHRRPRPPLRGRR